MTHSPSASLVAMIYQMIEAGDRLFSWSEGWFNTKKSWFNIKSGGMIWKVRGNVVILSAGKIKFIQYV